MKIIFYSTHILNQRQEYFKFSTNTSTFFPMAVWGACDYDKQYNYILIPLKHLRNVEY